MANRTQPAPALTDVYVCYDRDRTVIYVGMTNDLLRRMGQHLAGSPWWADVRRVDVEHYSTREGAALRESLLIQALDPWANVAGNEPAVSTTLASSVPGRHRRQRASRKR